MSDSVCVADGPKAAVHFERAGDVQKAVHLVTENSWELINLGHSPALRELLERFRPQGFPSASR